MSKLYNQKQVKTKRKKLRNNPTEAEKRLWYFLRKKQVEGVKFRRQFSIGKYIVDFYSPKLKIAIELDGGQHAENKNAQYDDKRTEYLEKEGVTVLRFWNNQIFQNTEAVLKIIKDTVLSRQRKDWRPPLTPP